MADIQSMRDDLSFMRGLAEAGRGPSRRGGLILAAGGFAYGLASFAQFGLLHGATRVTAATAWTPWLAATLVFYAVLAVQVRAMRREDGRPHPASPPLAGAAWSALGAAMATLMVAAAAAGAVTRSASAAALLPSAFLAMYGVGWSVSAAAAGRGWMRVLAVGGFAGAVIMACLAGSPALWLGYGAALILLGGVPGLALARGPRAG